MSTIQKFPDSEFPTIYCTRFVVNPTTTTLKWNPARKHPQVQMLGLVDLAKTLTAGPGEKGILGSVGSVIGTDTLSWYYEIKEPVMLHVGMALFSQDLTTVTGVAIDQLLNVSESDKVRFLLNATGNLNIRHERGDETPVSINNHNLAFFTGQTLYPWVSTVPTDTMSVKIMLDVKLQITVDPDGKVKLDGDLDLPENTLTNTNTDSTVILDDDGDINLNGGISFKCDNITDPIPCIELQKDQFGVIVSNSASTKVLLPDSGSNKCQYYSVMRNYPLQIGETWHNPVLKLTASGSNNIEGCPFIGIPPDANIQVMSDGLGSWRIM